MSARTASPLAHDNDESETVTFLLRRGGHVVSVYSKEADARARMEKFNADPFLAPGHPDPDAPYSIARWHVQSPAEAQGSVPR